MKFVIYLYIHHINILHKYGWNHILDNNVMSLYLTVSACAEHVEIFVIKFVKSKY